MKKIIRSLCLFTENPGENSLLRLSYLRKILEEAGFEIQTRRLVTGGKTIKELNHFREDRELFLGAGTLSREQVNTQLEDYLSAGMISFNLEIHDRVSREDVDILFRLITQKAEKTFLFSYTFSNPVSTPYFPAAHFGRDGFSLGLQPTDLSEGCDSLHTWLYRTREVWYELLSILEDEPDFLGIDSSIAPMYSGDSSLVHLINRTRGSFEQAVTSDVFVSLSRFIKEENPKPVGLCGIMFPCLEDFLLADEYEKGAFSIERNIFLSLHSGLGIDTYPVGTDEDPERIRQILNLLMALSQKYGKPLSARFISDGKTRIGQKSDFQNKFLKDVVIRPL